MEGHQGKKLPCQFFLLGTCQHAKGDDCRFSHDPNVCKPGILKEQCLHYQKGHCRNGNFCLNLHDRGSRDKALLEPKGKVTTTVPVVRTNTDTFSAFGSKPIREVPNGKPVTKTGFVSLSKNHGHSARHPTSAEQEQEAPQLSQDAYHRALEADEQLYFFGSMPSGQGGETQQPKAVIAAPPDWKKFSQKTASEVQASQEYEAFLEKQRVLQLQLQMQQLAVQNNYATVCKFFLQGSCKNGATCRFSHVMPAYDPEAELVAFEKSASKDLECGICLENVMSSGDGRFGLLTGCDHAFCLKCIKNWRSSEISTKDDAKELVRRCPLCREASFFVVPCDRMVRDPERKQAIVAKYQAGMKKIDCKHFDNGRGACPFGTSCFYRHIYPDGREQDPTDLRTYKDAEGNTKVDSSARLSSFLNL